VGSSNRDSLKLSPRGADSRRPFAFDGGTPNSNRRDEILGAPDAQINLLQASAKSPRLVADRQYFGIEAEALQAGAERTLARLSNQSPDEQRIDVRTLSEDFLTDSAGAGVLLSQFLAGGLLHPNGAGAYLPTRHFRQCALACVVAPMTRDRAKSVIDRACKLAEQINKEWTRNPFRIKTIIVSGSYMTRRKELSELSLSLGLSRRQEARTGGTLSSEARDEAGRQIIQAMSKLSSFIAVRIVSGAARCPASVQRRLPGRNFVHETSAPGLGPVARLELALTRRLASR
jgi:hypothetical protein